MRQEFEARERRMRGKRELEQKVLFIAGVGPMPLP